MFKVCSRHEKHNNTVVNETISGEEKNEVQVPQGRMLGPLELMLEIKQSIHINKKCLIL